MVKSNYVPEKGVLGWLDFDPQTGHEQKGRCPAICISQKNTMRKLVLLYSALLQVILKATLLKLYWTIILPMGVF